MGSVTCPPLPHLGSASGWKHHVLVQALLSRGPLPEKEVHSIFREVTGKDPVTQKKLFNGYLLKINTELANVQFELRGCRNQYDGEVYYGVVNNVADEQSKLGSKFSLPQIAFYKGIVEAIIMDPLARGFISQIEALNIRLENLVQASESSQDTQSWISPTFKNFSMSQKERTLNDLICDGWLHCNFEHKVCLGMRSFLDLRSWFRSNDIPSCEVCNEAGVKAELCSNDDCTARIHHYCLKQIFNKKAPRGCPSCGTSWNYHGEDEDDHRQESPAHVEEENPKQAQVPLRKPSVTGRQRTRSFKEETVSVEDPGVHIRRKSQRIGSKN